jgi:hypothetical protein
MTDENALRDRLDVRELYSRHAIAIDNHQADAWVACFTEDGIFESGLLGKHVGAEGLKKFTKLYRESLGGAQVLHIISNVHFQLEGEAGVGSCYLTYYHCKEGRIQQAAVGRYRDTLRKVDGRWFFASRALSLDGHH